MLSLQLDRENEFETSEFHESKDPLGGTLPEIDGLNPELLIGERRPWMLSRGY